MSEEDNESADSQTEDRKAEPQREENGQHSLDVDPMRRHIVDAPPGSRTKRREADQDEDEDDAREDDKKSSSKKDSDDGQKEDEDQDSAEEKKKKDNPKRKWILAIVAAVVLALLIIFGLPWYLHERHFESTDDAFVDAHWEKIAPRVAGRVVKIYFDDNADVQAGQTILSIDPADLQVAVEQQEGALAEAQGRLAQAKAQKLVSEAGVGQSEADVARNQVSRDNNAIELKRYEGLTSEAVSAQRLDDLRATVRSADAQLLAAQKSLEASKAQVALSGSQIEAAQATVVSSTAQLDNARLQLSYTEVKALTGGRVTQRGVREGDYVSVGQQLMNLVPHEVWITANYKETQLTDMKPGQTVELEVDAYPDDKLTGKVQSIQAGTGAWFSLLPPENATGNYVKVVQRVPVKITVEDTGSDAYRRLSPGMSIVPKVRVR